MEHVDYPHYPGMLDDCYVCMNHCFCEEDFECIHCVMVDNEEIHCTSKEVCDTH